MAKKIEKSAKELLAEGKLLRIQISFTDNECDIYNYLQAKPKMAKFVKGLIRQAMLLEKAGGEPSALFQNLSALQSIAQPIAQDINTNQQEIHNDGTNNIINIVPSTDNSSPLIREEEIKEEPHMIKVGGKDKEKEKENEKKLEEMGIFGAL